MKKDFYVKLIEHADSFESHFSKQEVLDHLGDIPKWQKDAIDNYFINALSNRLGNPYKETFFNFINGSLEQNGKEETRSYVLSSEAKFRYLDFQELQLAREASTAARKHSNIALRISIAALLIAAAGAWFEFQSMVYQKQQTELASPTTNYQPPTTTQ